MELAVELIVCLRSKRWYSHYEFINRDSTIGDVERLAIDQAIERIDNGEMKGVLKKEDLKYIGVMNSKVLS